ncbi:hypothetical protein DIPPA_09081 [Diplonema papillatum]|nr:hypothetical protein DIPPA_09081 [Diplonema papillatum]
MPDCRAGWLYGQTSVPSWAPSSVYEPIGAVGALCALVQVLSALHPAMRSLAHRGLQLLALSDFVQALWWCVVARHSLGSADTDTPFDAEQNETRADTLGSNWYSREESCRLLEFARLSSAHVGIVCVAMLCLLLAASSHSFYNFRVLSRRRTVGFATALTILPIAVVCNAAAWRQLTPCPVNGLDPTEKWFEHVSAVVYLTLTFAAFASIASVWWCYCSKRSGAVPRLLFLPLSLVLRGMVPLMTVAGWFGGSCPECLAGVHAVVVPALPVLNFLVFFCRRKVWYWVWYGYPVCPEAATPLLHAQDCSPSPARVPTIPRSEVGSERDSVYNLPSTLQQMYLDFLWGFTSQGFLMQKRSRRLGSSLANSDLDGRTITPPESLADTACVDVP